MAVGLGGQSPRSMLKLKKKYQLTLRTCVMPHFHGILTCKSFYGIISVIQRELQGKMINFKVIFLKIIFVINTKINKHNNLIIM